MILSKNVEVIEKSAFENCYGFVGSLTLPKSIQNVESRVFYNCSGFDKSLVLPSLARIRSRSFSLTNFEEIKYLGKTSPICDSDIGLPIDQEVIIPSDYLNDSFCYLHIRKIDKKDKKDKKAFIIGGVLGSILLCTILLCIIFFVYKYNKNEVYQPLTNPPLNDSVSTILDQSQENQLFSHLLKNND